MNPAPELDLSVLSQFKAADLLAEGAPSANGGSPMQVALHRIDFDPLQPRRRLRGRSIEELAESIRQHGVLEPVSLRRDTKREGRFIVNRGERRVRAARLAGLAAIPAFLDERLDPFAQAAENLHREDMSPLDLAAFIAEREAQGHARAEIARRLGKSRSFVTEAASLVEAPASLRRAIEEGRIGGDMRVLYRLAAVARSRPDDVEALLSGGGALRRAALDELLGRSVARGHAGEAPMQRGSAPGRVSSGGRTVLIVEHAGRRGSLRLKARDSDVGEVRFGDGTCCLLPLTELRPVCWASED
ncbi:ParB/RepB/Spo0J family partition protein [Variovorax sp. DT-64]|uniref:ParB/RepB/Spo0J family partition protein n=1 Tax=Variovorax sp. DT-64 TaxID=3396160 RepID=UPI003F1C74A2